MSYGRGGSHFSLFCLSETGHVLRFSLPNRLLNMIHLQNTFLLNSSNSYNELGHVLESNHHRRMDAVLTGTVISLC